jgi:hypothetical protein
MTSKSRRRMPALLAVPVLVGSLAVAGCGTTTIDPATGEKAIKADVPKLNGTVKSVSCPSGVDWKQGQVITCKATVTDNVSGVTRSGTITLHLNTTTSMFSFGRSDLHF